MLLEELLPTRAVKKMQERSVLALPKAVQVRRLGDWDYFDDIRRIGSAEEFVLQFANAPKSVWGIEWGRTEARKLATDFDLEGQPYVALRLVESGATLYYTGLDKFSPNLAFVARALERELGTTEGSCRVQAVVSTPGAGVGMHFDPDTAFNIQIFGTKVWKAAENRWFRNPMEAGGKPGDYDRPTDEPVPDRMPKDAKEFDARPGTVVFLPRATLHQTRVTGSKTSLALVFGIHPRTVLDLAVDNLKSALATEARFREFSIAQDEAQQYRELADAMSSLSAKDWAAAAYGVPPSIGGRQLRLAEGVRCEKTASGDLLVTRGRTRLPIDGLTGECQKALLWFCKRSRHVTMRDILDASWTDPDVLSDILSVMIEKKMVDLRDD